MPSAPDVVITPAPKRLGNPWRTIAGSMIDPIAITVAGDDPDTAANSAHAITPASPRPPYQCPTIEVAKLIMRRATPPWVRKFPARMKNGMVMIAQFAGAPVRNRDLEKPEAHQVGAKRNAEVDQPARNLEIGGDLVGVHQPDHEFRAHGTDHGGEEGAAEQAEQNNDIPPRRFELVDQNIDADMDAGAHAIGRTELRHPHEHVDAQLLRPRQIDGKQQRIKQGNADEVAMHDRKENDEGRERHQRRDQYLLKPVEDAKKHDSP